jgi:hypothetical protein
MYSFCQKFDLSQVWAYMWNCWYSPKQWPLWARSVAPAILRLKTTMVSEAQWKVIKHNDLAMFNRPRLDLVVHVLIGRLLPPVKLTLANILGTRRTGRASSPNDWQNDFRALWLDMSKPDEQRNIESQLEVLRTSKKTKGRAECLAELEAKAERPSGAYYTNVIAAHRTSLAGFYYASILYAPHDRFRPKARPWVLCLTSTKPFSTLLSHLRPAQLLSLCSPKMHRPLQRKYRCEKY